MFFCKSIGEYSAMRQEIRKMACTVNIYLLMVFVTARKIY